MSEQSIQAIIEANPSSPSARLLDACPFLWSHQTEYWDCGDTIVFGDVGTLLIDRKLASEDEDATFAYFNVLAETGDDNDLTVLATGAIELFNDTAKRQQLARKKLKGAALQMLEDCRVGWGQPDYRMES